MRRRSRDERHGRRPHGAPLLPNKGAKRTRALRTRGANLQSRDKRNGAWQVLQPAENCLLPPSSAMRGQNALAACTQETQTCTKSGQEKLRLASTAACRDLPAHVCFEERQPDRAPHMCAVALHRGAISASGSAASCSQPACLERVWPAVTLTHVPRADKHVNVHVVLGSATMLGACPRGRGLSSSTCQLLACRHQNPVAQAANAVQQPGYWAPVAHF